MDMITTFCCSYWYILIYSAIVFDQNTCTENSFPLAGNCDSHYLFFLSGAGTNHWQKHQQIIFEQKSFSAYMNIHFCIFSWLLSWSGNWLSNILSFLSELCLWDNFSDTSLSIFGKCTSKNNINKWNCFQVRAYRNWLIHTPHQVILNTGPIFIIQWIKNNYLEHQCWHKCWKLW